MSKKLIYMCCKILLWIFPVKASQVCKSYYKEIKELQKELKE